MIGGASSKVYLLFLFIYLFLFVFRVLLPISFEIESVPPRIRFGTNYLNPQIVDMDTHPRPDGFLPKLNINETSYHATIHGRSSGFASSQP